MNGLKAPRTAKKPGLAEYQRIEIALRQQIGEGQWTIGAMLPSRRALARQYAVSLVTLDRAIGPLLADGTLRADDRRGTFVLKPLVGPPKVQDVGFAAEVRPTAVSSGTIGIIASLVHVHGQEYFILHELEQALSQQGFSTAVFNRASDPAHPRSLADAAQALLAENVTALVVICLDLDRLRIAQELGRMNLGSVPMVCILAGELTLPIPHVFYDNRSGGYQAAQHLFERGWGEFTVVAPFQSSWVSERIAGIRDAAQHSGLAGNVSVLSGDGREWDSFEDPRPLGCEAARTAMAQGWTPHGGMICVSDGVAFGVLDAARECGLEAGRDFAILGFDDEPNARVSGLTSLRPPMQGMAREAARVLKDYISGNDVSLQVRLRAQVIPRASTVRHG